MITTLFLSCFEDNDDDGMLGNVDNKVVLLKVDYQTHTFEGGKELAFGQSAGFTIASEYEAPGDFGSIELIYEELGQTLFEGTIVWMGLGERSYPESLLAVDDFVTVPEAVEMPSQTLFENVMYDEFAFYPEDLDYASLWEAIDNLQIVQTYRASNPDGTVSIFLYTPSVGAGDPADWDYYVILKN